MRISHTNLRMKIMKKSHCISVWMRSQLKKSCWICRKKSKNNYGKLPKAVQLLFEKKRLDILLNEPHVENITEEQKFVNVTFTSAWSTRIDGVN